MKGLTVILLITIPYYIYSQGVFTNQTHSALQKVISDYPNQFRNIRGNIINADPQSTDYASTVVIPGALNSVVTQYSSNGEKEIYSWKCIMLASEDFDTATKKYKDLFDQIKNSIIKVEGEQPFILNGAYQTPTQEKRFTASTFQLLPAASGYLKQLKVELTLEYYVTEWKLSLLVYDQEDGELVME